MMEPRSHGCIAAAALLLLGGRAAAEPGGPASSRACPALFGDGTVRRENRDHRRRDLHWVHQEPDGITVAHSSDDWRAPVELAIKGLALVETAAEVKAGRKGRHAVLEVSPRIASVVGCPAGRYRLTLDDGITPASRVLAVLHGLLLLEHDGRLAFLAAPGVSRPRWLMAWRVRASLRPPRSGVARVAPPSRPPQRRR